MLREILYFADTVFRFESAALFCGLKRDGVVKGLMELCRALAGGAEAKTLIGKYYEWLSALMRVAENAGYEGNIFAKHVINLFLEDENPFSLACENGRDVLNTSLYRLAVREMETLRYFVDFDVQNICDNVGFGEDVVNYAPLKAGDNGAAARNERIKKIELMTAPEDILRQLMRLYQNDGCGRLATHRMFVLNGQPERESGALRGVPNADRVAFSDIFGYDEQKRALRHNTEAFLAGFPANNVLLAGPSGTGKSSCVKALANEYCGLGLRLIEVDSCDIYKLKGVLAELGGRGKRFIIFIDDLSFEAPNRNYLAMKSMLEGNAAICPSNVLFYATSNRRHLVRELWSDRAESTDTDEVHATDTMAEKLSLSDRFGLTLFFMKPTPEQYLGIVEGIARKEKLAVPPDFLRELAMKWEVGRKGRSGRTARQFINNVIGEMRTD